MESRSLLMKHFKKQAFSLIELSVVLLIIGLLTTAITSGAQMIKKSRLANAQLLTTRSGINKMPNLGLWFETTLSQSIEATEAREGKTVTTWHDLNEQEPNKSNATQATAGKKPIYTIDAINNLPALKFTSGNGTYLQVAKNAYSNDFTLFAVIKPLAAGVGNTGSDLGVASSPILHSDISGTRRDVTPLTIGNSKLRSFTGTDEYTLEGTSNVFNGNAHIATVTRNMGLGALTLRVNGTTEATHSGGTTVPFDEVKITTIAGNTNDGIYYSGYIGEIIIFSRHLSDNEIKTIEKYLSAKWGVKIN